MAKTYCQVAGVVLLAVGVLGIFWKGIGTFLSIGEPAEIVVHLVTGAIAAYAGFRATYGSAAMAYAKIFGIVYLVLALAGFLRADVLPGVIHFDLGCNLVHLVLGVWGVWAGYFATEAKMARA